MESSVKIHLEGTSTVIGVSGIMETSARRNEDIIDEEDTGTGVSGIRLK